MTIKQLLQEANAIQIGIDATDWRQVIALAAEPWSVAAISMLLILMRSLPIRWPMALTTCLKRGSPFPMRDRTQG